MKNISPEAVEMKKVTCKNNFWNDESLAILEPRIKQLSVDPRNSSKSRPSSKRDDLLSRQNSGTKWILIKNTTNLKINVPFSIYRIVTILILERTRINLQMTSFNFHKEENGFSFQLGAKMRAVKCLFRLNRSNRTKRRSTAQAIILNGDIGIKSQPTIHGTYLTTTV